MKLLDSGFRRNDEKGTWVFIQSFLRETLNKPVDRHTGEAGPRRHDEKQRGFTLVEVLVALAVLTIALAAVMRALSQSIDTSSSLRDRALAMWVAQNRLVTHQIQKDWPGLDTTEGTATMAGREWRWREQVLAAPGEADLRQIHIEVRAANGTQALARLIGFLPKP